MKAVPPALKWSLLSVAGLVVVLILFLALFDWNLLRGPLGRAASRHVGRQVTIGGLQAHVFSSEPTFAVTGLIVSNPPWAGPRPMLEVGRIAVQVKLWPLLAGHLTVLHADVDRPVVNLRRNASGAANWEFADTGAKHGGRDQPLHLPVIRDFKLRDGRVDIQDAIRKLKFHGSINAGENSMQQPGYAFRLNGDGMLNDRKFELAVKGGPLINVERDRPYPFAATLMADTTELAVNGSLNRPFDLGDVRVGVSASGHDLADVYYLTGLALPNTRPYDVVVHLQRRSNEIRIDNLDGRVGGSDVSGQMVVKLGGSRPLVEGTITSHTLDLKDIAASLGNAPPASTGRLLPDAPLQVQRVRGMDARINFSAESIKLRNVPLRQVAVRVNLDDGLLRLDPVSVILPQGHVTGDVNINARGDIPAVSAQILVRNVQLKQFHGSKGLAPLDGTLTARMQIRGRGASVSEALAHSQGSITAIVPEGQIEEAFAELAGIDVAEGLGLVLSKDERQIPVRCGIADFGLQNGELAARHVLFDTQNVRIDGSGKIALNSEKVDLKIQGKPKKLRLVRLNAPISIKGTLRKPRIGIQPEKTVLQAGAAVALAAVATPLAAVLPFVDPGLAKDANCAALVAENEPKAQPSDPRTAQQQGTAPQDQ